MSDEKKEMSLNDRLKASSYETKEKLEAGTEKIKEKAEEVKEAVSEKVEEIKEDVSEAGENLETKAEEKVDSVKEDFTDAEETLNAGKAEEVKDDVVLAADNAQNKAEEVTVESKPESLADEVTDEILKEIDRNKKEALNRSKIDKKEEKVETVKTETNTGKKNDDVVLTERYVPSGSSNSSSVSKFFKTLFKGLLVICLGLASGYGGAYLFNKTNKSNTADNVVSSLVSSEESSEEGNVVTTVSVAQDLSAVVEKVSDSVVQIETEYMVTSYFWGGSYPTSGAGSGVILTSDGYIVTNYHVIEDATKISVVLSDNETTYDATVVGYDENNDIAVLKVEASGLKAVTLGSSTDVKTGQSVLVIGNPLGTLGGSVTSGIISAISRNIQVEGVMMTLIQVDAAVNEGNSGGGLFDTNGNLIGIVNAKYVAEEVEGIGFAIPVDTVKEVVENIMNNPNGASVNGNSSDNSETGNRRVLLGVTVLTLQTEAQAQQYGLDEPGVYISAVNDGSDAEKAGLEVGDRVISADGEEISSGSQLSEIVQSHEPGDTMNIIVMRDNQEISFDVVLSEQ